MSEIEKRIIKLYKKWRYEKDKEPGCLFLGYAEEIALYQSEGYLLRGSVEVKKYYHMKIIRVDASHYLAVGDVMEAETHE